MKIFYEPDTIEEFNFISASPAWNRENGETQTNPGIYAVQIDDDYIGKYKLDGTIETYQAAVNNFEMILKKLLKNDYCKSSDFQNFEFYL